MILLIRNQATMFLRGLAPTTGRGCGRQVQKNKIEFFSETKRLLEPPPVVGREAKPKATR